MVVRVMMVVVVVVLRLAIVYDWCDTSSCGGDAHGDIKAQ